jgi:lauroyl/myristoyl acyltransferase
MFSLLPPPLPYLLARSLSHFEYRYHYTKRESVKKWMVQCIKEANFSEKDLDLATRQYFEVVYCDEIDIFVYLLGSSKSFLRKLKIEGEEHLEGLKERGGILLSAHFGGGFWILPFLKHRGIHTHFFSNDIKKEDYPFKKASYLYDKLWLYAIEKASGTRVLYKGGGRGSLIRALKERKWVIVLFDVPPFLVKENMEVSFLGRKARFPKGIMSIAKEMNVPILPFFSFLEKGKYRRVCFEKPIYVKKEEDCVEQCVRLIESRIIEKPNHWHLWPTADQFFLPPF